MASKKKHWLEPPQHSLASISGHEILKTYLESAIEGDMLPHALLFHGPKGVGKLSMAYGLAKRLNCRLSAQADCKCSACRKISEGSFADILLVEPRGAAGQITLAGWKPGKDDPDNVQYYRFIDSRPLEGTCKIIIIRMAERMNIAFANHILKLMEEPPSYLKLVLTTHRRNDLLATIRSRCAPVKFSPLPLDAMQKLAASILGEPATSPEVGIMARLSDGRPGQLATVSDESNSARRAEIARLMKQFQTYGFISLFRTASDLQEVFEGGRTSGATGQEAAESILYSLTAWLRDAALSKALPPDLANRLLIHSDQKVALTDFSEKLPLDAILRSSQCIQDYLSMVGRQMDRSFILESLLMQLGRAMRPS